eukprot:TRINITY_DN35890_c0_g1_i1.p1 TRINITY_DN35890_c0_g1~~TRINITY_DN35890_c0_g1_i1.p1  ORF type:complete len:813 (+),score=272.77 TRINITY_DN35890_c0_g1_i1:26-2440(+)
MLKRVPVRLARRALGEAQENALMRNADFAAEAKTKAPVEKSLEGLIRKDAVASTTRPRRQSQSAFDEMRGDVATGGDILNKVHPHSVETLKYGMADELSEFKKSGEQFATTRDLPSPQTLSMWDDKFKKDRAERLQSAESDAPPAAAAGSASPADAPLSDSLMITSPPAEAPAKGPQIAITYVNPYHIPDVLRGTDQCPGCGALMQCREKFAPGYTPLLSIKMHIEEHDRMMKYKETYLKRQEVLHENVQQYGFRPGMEYQDYMTEEELEAMFRYSPRPVICERCTQLNESQYDVRKTVMSVADWRDELAEIGDRDPKKGRLIVHIVSLWDFETCFRLHRDIRRMAKGNPILMIGTHGDALPYPWGVRKSTRNKGHHDPEDEELKEVWQARLLGELSDYMARRCKDEGYRVADCIAVGKPDLNIELAISAIEKWRRGGDVYLTGAVNVGKSTFVNALYEKYKPSPAPHPEARLVTDVSSGGKNKPVAYTQRWEIPEEASAPEKAFALTVHNPFEKDIRTVSGVPGTTIKNMSFSIHSRGRGGKAEESRIVDTPGIMQKGMLSTVLPLGLVSMLSPKMRMSFRFFRVAPGDSLFVTSLVRVDVVKGVADGVLIKGIARWSRATAKVVPTAEADVFHEQWKGVRGVLSPPSRRLVAEDLGPLVECGVYYIELSDGGRAQELVVDGVCVLNISLPGRADQRMGADCVLRVSAVKGLSCSLRPAMLNLARTLPNRTLFRKRDKSHTSVEDDLLELASQRSGLPRKRSYEGSMVTPPEEEEDDEGDDGVGASGPAGFSRETDYAERDLL